MRRPTKGKTYIMHMNQIARIPAPLLPPRSAMVDRMRQAIADLQEPLARVEGVARAVELPADLQADADAIHAMLARLQNQMQVRANFLSAII